MLGAIGILVSGVIGPAVISWFAERRAAREHEYARVLADRNELRGLLDEAEQGLRTGERLASIASTLRLRPRETKRYVDELHEALREIDRESGRLELRLGSDHPAVAAYRESLTWLTTPDTALQLASQDAASALEQSQ